MKDEAVNCPGAMIVKGTPDKGLGESRHEGTAPVDTLWMLCSKRKNSIELAEERQGKISARACVSMC